MKAVLMDLATFQRGVERVERAGAHEPTVDALISAVRLACTRAIREAASKEDVARMHDLLADFGVEHSKRLIQREVEQCPAVTL